MNLDVDDETAFDTVWLDGTPIITGSVTIEISSVQDDGTVLYLQDDKTTVSATPNTSPMVLVGTIWRYPLKIPDSMDGMVFSVTRVHSDPDMSWANTNLRVGKIVGGTVTNPATTPVPSARFD